MNLNDRLNALRNPQAVPITVEPPVATLGEDTRVDLEAMGEGSAEALFHAPAAVPASSPIAPAAQPLVKHSAAVDPLGDLHLFVTRRVQRRN